MAQSGPGALPGALEEALERVRARIEQSCRRAGRPVDSVTLVAVTKTVPPDVVRAILAHGQAVFGENRVQEALGKREAVGPGARWHLVGRLQQNKARHAAGAFELIHSVDGLELGRELDKRAASAGTVQPVLVQVNVAGEPTKGGALPHDVPALLAGLAALRNLDLRGLMAIPPPAEEPEDARPWFVRLRQLRDESATRLPRPFPELSMGMTDDFEVAIEEGATLVRVGRALFGDR